MSRAHILFENEDWMPPLRAALAARGVPWTEHFVDGGVLDLASVPTDGVYINRMSPSAHTRGHQGGAEEGQTSGHKPRGRLTLHEALDPAHDPPYIQA